MSDQLMIVVTDPAHPIKDETDPHDVIMIVVVLITESVVPLLEVMIKEEIAIHDVMMNAVVLIIGSDVLVMRNKVGNDPHVDLMMIEEDLPKTVHVIDEALAIEIDALAMRNKTKSALLVDLTMREEAHHEIKEIIMIVLHEDLVMIAPKEIVTKDEMIVIDPHVGLMMIDVLLEALVTVLLVDLMMIVEELLKMALKIVEALMIVLLVSLTMREDLLVQLKDESQKDHDHTAMIDSKPLQLVVVLKRIVTEKIKRKKRQKSNLYSELIDEVEKPHRVL